jgi:NAD(P)-dependent dehydrogenase (short-subunit alcohol dehydrogenase family)
MVQQARVKEALVSRTDSTPVPDYPALLRLNGRGIIVVGAGQGIGRQAAHAVSALGARAVCVDRDASLAEDVAKEVSGLAVRADVTDRAGMERVVWRAVEELGRLDGLIDIVGMATYMSLLELDDGTWNSQFDICLRHAFLAVQIAGRAMRETGGGSMAFVASISGLAGAPNHAAYGAAKAGLMSLVRSAAVELGPSGIRVNAVAPGGTLTPRVSAALTPARRTEHEALLPTGRLNEPADIASALLFLVSDLSANLTGQTLVVDGGVTSRYAFQ